jgi:hypothetical protein
MASKKYSDFIRDLHLGTTVPSCPSKIAPFILQNHQLGISKYLSEHDSLLLWHGLGSGKTITSIASAFESYTPAAAGAAAPINNVLVACPASLMDNYQDELDRYKDFVLLFTTMPHSGIAIDIANKFIQEFQEQSKVSKLPEPDWFRGFIEKLIMKIGTTGDISKFTKFSDIQSIVASNSEPTYDASLTGGKTKRKRKRKTQKGGYKRSMRITIDTTFQTKGDIEFIFKSTNGNLNTGGFGDLSRTYLIIIDESQLFISQLRLDYAEVDLRSKLPSFSKGFIPIDEFQVYIDKTYGHVGYKNARPNVLYRELLSRPAHTKLALLSATPIIKNKYEISIFVNLLARKTLMPVNASVFEHNYGITNRTADYTYDMSSGARNMNILGKIHSRIRNEKEFVKNCKGLVSVFGNVAEMLPPLILLKTLNTIPVKHIYNNDGNPFLNIIECPLSKNQALYIKYFQFVCETHGGVLGPLKTQFYDCAFPLDSPEDPGAKVSSTHLDESGASTGRADGRDIVVGKYLHSFQKFLDETVTVAERDGIGVKNKIPPKAQLDVSVALKASPISLTNLQKENGKLKALMKSILSGDGNGRHVIYVTSRYVSVIIGRLLEFAGLLELKNKDQLGTVAGVTPLPNKLFAYLRGESEDDSDPVAPGILRYTNDEGNAENKAELIKLYNSDQHYDKFKILIINNCVAEGITLKRTDFIHIISIPYDLAKLQQIVARVYRNCVHPPGGTITPYIYITTESNDDALTPADYSTLHRENIEWQQYPRRLERDYEINDLVRKIRENDELLPYYRLIKQCSIENEP